MSAGWSIRRWAAPLLLAFPLALQAQDLPAPASPGEPVSDVPEVSGPSEGSAAGPCHAPTPSDAAQPVVAAFTPPEDASSGVPAENVPAEIGPTENLPADCQPAVPALPPRPPAPDIFGLSAVPVGLKATTREGEAWGRVSTTSLQGVSGPWNELLDRPGLPDAENLLVTVNQWVNWHVRYAADKDPNQWNLPATTLLEASGDCADYAVAKMALLQQLGVAPEDMFLVVLRDEGRSQDHAVLAVRREETMYVLDNRTDLVLPAERIHDYRPILSYNGPFAWVYGKRTTERKDGTPGVER